jgi:hypothetical protein
MGKKNPYDSKKTFGIANEEQNKRDWELSSAELRANQGTWFADQTANSVDPAAERYYSPNGMSDWKRGQINTRTSSVNRSYDDELAANKLRARMAGFGYTQPVEQAAETNIENARANDLSRIKGDVEAEAVPIEMQAMNTRLQSGAQRTNDYGNFGRLKLGIAGEYSPEQYYQTAVQQKEAEQARKGSLFGKIAKAGMGLATGGGFGSLTGAL